MKNREIELMVRGNIENRLANAVSSACNYSSKIYLQTGSKKINVKSIMGMFSIIANAGDRLTLIAEGSDEEEAIDSVARWLTVE